MNYGRSLFVNKRKRKQKYTKKVPFQAPLGVYYD